MSIFMIKIINIDIVISLCYNAAGLKPSDYKLPGNTGNKELKYG